MAAMAVPEAPMYEYHSPVFGKYKIRRAGQILGVQSESETQSKKAFTNQDFRLRILAANARHTETSLLGSQNVRHTTILLLSGESSILGKFVTEVIGCLMDNCHTL